MENKVITVTSPLLPSLEDFIPYLEDIWNRKWLTNNGYYHKELEKALFYAAKYDRKVIMEEAIDGREFECAVLGNEDKHISGIGEIVTTAEFYDYDAKYHNALSRTIIPGEVEAEALAQMRKISEKIYHAVDASGLARVDFFMEKSGRVLFNELNTMPGFTSISMYPMLWEEEGMSKTELMDRLIALALERDNGIHG